MSNSPISSYPQLSEPVDAYIPGSDGQLIDLDELYTETGQEMATTIVEGTEAINLGKLSRDLAVRLKMKDPHQYDPFPSQRNSVMGTEGFFATLYDGFKDFIENIIKYIRMAFNWVAESVKGLLGFRKSERINKAIDDALPNLQQEFKTTLSGLGFPSSEYNLDSFIGKLPSSVDRIGQMTLMKSKFETDQEAIQGLSAALPLFQQCSAKLTECSNKATRSRDNYKRVIKDEYNRTRVRRYNFDSSDGSDSPEVNRVVTAGQEMLRALDPQGLASSVSALLQTLYKVEFTNEELSSGFDKVRKQLEVTVITGASKLSAIDMSVVMTNIQQLNARYSTISDDTIDLSSVNLRDMGDVIERTDAEKIKLISQYYNDPTPLTTYQEVAVSLRNYSNFCQMVSRQLLIVERQINNLTRWYARSHLWFLHGLLNDMEKLRELNLEARADGHAPKANHEGYPTLELEFISDADAKTFLEKLAGTSQEFIEKDLAGLKTNYNRVVKQLGIGETL